MAAWDLVGYAVFREGTMTDYNTGAAEFTSDKRIYVPVYEVPDEYVTTPSTGQNAEITANWPAEGGVDVDQKIISMTSANDTGGPGHRVYMEGIGDGSMTIKGESKYMLGSTMPLPGEFILGRGVGGAGFIPFRYYCDYSMGGVFTTHTVDPEAIPKDVYVVEAINYDKTVFLSGMAMGLTGIGKPKFEATDTFSKGYLVGAELRAKRVLPTGYSYNGTVLPKLPVWDKETYPYAYIDVSGNGDRINNAFVVCDAPLTYEKPSSFDYNIVRLYGKGCNFILDNGEWVLLGEDVLLSHYYNQDNDVVFWANHNIISKIDGSVYLAASKPIPVYE